MKQIIQKGIYTLFAISLLSLHIGVLAQENKEPGKNIEDTSGSATLSESGVKEGELVNCFDYYKFQDGINITAGVDQSKYKPYDMVEIGGEIVNKNTYPITNVSVKARILKNHPNPVERRAQYVIVDEFLVVDNINLKVNENYPIRYAYAVPGNATNGEYIIQYYVYNQDRFNLSGLSFTEDIIGNKTLFTIEGGKENIYLDSTNITVDGREHNTRGFVLKVNKNKQIPVRIPLVNPTNVEKEMEVNYKLYKWDGLLESNLVENITQSKMVAANSKIDLEYLVNTESDPVYYAIITAKGLSEKENSTIKNKTIAYVRFSVNENNRPRINWVGLDKYPFKEGEEVKVVTCAHNTTYANDKGPIKVQSIVKNAKGKELTKIEYEGEMPSAISGIMNKFKAPKNINKITIETNLYNASNDLVDSITTTYDCNQLSPESCSKDGIISLNNTTKNILYLAGVGLGIITGFLVIRKYRKNNNKLN
jgi:hypothetical protein